MAQAQTVAPLANVRSMCVLRREVMTLWVLVWGTLPVSSEYNPLPQPVSLCELAFQSLNLLVHSCCRHLDDFLNELFVDSDRNLKHKSKAHVCGKSWKPHSAGRRGKLGPPRSKARRQHRNIRKKTWGVEQKYSRLREAKIGWGNKENFIQRWENSAFNNTIRY